MIVNMGIIQYRNQFVIPTKRLQVGEGPMTSSGGNLIGSEVNRNKWSPQCGATSIEVAGISPGRRSRVEGSPRPQPIIDSKNGAAIHPQLFILHSSFFIMQNAFRILHYRKGVRLS